MLAVIAGSCFPNCQPAPGAHVSSFQASGDTALGLAVLCIVVLLVLAVKGK